MGWLNLKWNVTCVALLGIAEVEVISVILWGLYHLKLYDSLNLRHNYYISFFLFFLLLVFILYILESSISGKNWYHMIPTKVAHKGETKQYWGLYILFLVWWLSNINILTIGLLNTPYQGVLKQTIRWVWRHDVQNTKQRKKKWRLLFSFL